ncbi:MAG: hypothetical protein HFE49_05675 [Clostridia bacterium]|nr:hypothetical protein [Clostridia bacterium]
MYIIEGIYRHSGKPSNRVMSKDKKYMKAKNQAGQYYRSLRKRLSEENIEILDKFVLYYDKEFERMNIQCFENGFKKGLVVALKSLEDNIK